MGHLMAFVHSSPTTLAPYRKANLGVFSSPRRFYKATEGIEEWPWAADNDGWSAWDAGRYRTMLNGIYGLRGCRFVTAPDVVGDAHATLARFEEWYDELSACWQPIALVGQDGMLPEQVPWTRIDAFFIGGSTAWKMGGDALALVREAQRCGLWVHMGRVNSHQRIRYAKAIGCDSFDGTSLSWFRDTYLRDFVRDAANPAHGMLFEPAASLASSERSTP